MLWDRERREGERDFKEFAIVMMGVSGVIVCISCVRSSAARITHCFAMASVFSSIQVFNWLNVWKTIHFTWSPLVNIHNLSRTTASQPDYLREHRSWHIQWTITPIFSKSTKHYIVTLARRVDLYWVSGRQEVSWEHMLDGVTTGILLSTCQFLQGSKLWSLLEFRCVCVPHQLGLWESMG